MINWRGIKKGTRCALANEKYSSNHNFLAICLNISRMLDGNEIEKNVRYEMLDEWNGTWDVMNRGYWKRSAIKKLIFFGGTHSMRLI